VAFVTRDDQGVQMAKTWVPVNDVKSRKAFAKAMRELVHVKKGRRYPRPPHR
jgi:hypothetical protein